MNNAYYYSDDTVIINYSNQYPTSGNELVDSSLFNEFLNRHIAHLKKHHIDYFSYLCEGGKTSKEIREELKHVIKALLVEAPENISHPYTADPKLLLAIIENGYTHWRSLQRYSILYSGSSEGYNIQNFIEADERFNALVLGLYREVQQKVQGSKNKVFRQLKAGTNASMLLSNYKWRIPEGYEKLKGIPFVNQIVLRTPLIIRPKHNKRTNKFTDAEINPMEELVRRNREWFAYPAKVGELLIYIYFHKDFISSCVAVANLFEPASEEEAVSEKPAAILIFGNPDGKKDTNFWHDEENDIWVGKVSASPEIEYFGYTKKSVLTLHNLAMMTRNKLPIHGAMVNIYLKDGRKKGIVLMGDSGAGKSETIEALNILASDLIDHLETVFDDMGTLHINEDGEVRAQGTEIGAFVRLDDLDKGTAYKDLDRSIFFNPEKENARVVLPAAPYDVISAKHKVDLFLYANNYEDKRGINIFYNREEAKPVFVEGKRFAIGTTQEAGLTRTFFANPFGPMQRQDECMVLIDKIFDALFEEGTPVGEVYTCLGLPDKGAEGLAKAAEAVLHFFADPDSADSNQD